MPTRDELVALARTHPELVVDKLLALIFSLEKRVKELEDRLNKNSNNSHKPPSSDGYTKPAPKSLREKSNRPSGGGRLTTELCTELSAVLDSIRVEGAEVVVRPVKEHRFVVLFREQGLSDQLTESDPQRLKEAPLKVEARVPEAERTAGIVNAFIKQAQVLLKEKHPANMILLRGFAKHPNLRTFQELYQLRAAAIAVYPMYRGLGKLVGMDALSTGPSVKEEFEVLRRQWQAYDFFYLHVKGTDSAGEDGNFAGKVAVIEDVDREIPKLVGLRPDVVVVSGDHSTPAALKSHSWHPVPLLLASRWCRPDGVQEFSERGCLQGGLGRLFGKQILPLALAHAERLTKFGA